jgi:hypothetical protein
MSLTVMLRFLSVIPNQKDGFASKVRVNVSPGFAAGCEAVAVPRRRVGNRSWALPTVRPLA